jgi:hypothetical protein
MKNKSVDQIMQELRASFKENELEYRVGATNRDKTKGLALAYVEARAIQNRLDEVVGLNNWRMSYREVQGGFICTLSLRIEGEWISKEDGAQVTEFESIKGGISSAFKRVASSGWGLGRYLYDLKDNWFPIEQSGKGYRFKDKPIISGNDKAIPEEKPEIKPVTVRTAVNPVRAPKKPYNDSFRLTFGKYKGINIEELYVQDRGYFMWLLKNGKSPDVVKACREFVERFA